jgi:hypothetical protein
MPDNRVRCSDGYEQASAIWMQYLTAYGALVHHGQADGEARRLPSENAA